MIMGPVPIIMPVLAYSLFGKALANLDVRTVDREVPPAGDGARLEDYLREHLPKSEWHLFAHAPTHAEYSHDMCYVVVVLKDVILVIDCIWNPACDSDPRKQDELRIATAISFSFAATTICEVKGPCAPRHSATPPICA